jgi:hypothetical protein
MLHAAQVNSSFSQPGGKAVCCGMADLLWEQFRFLRGEFGNNRTVNRKHRYLDIVVVENVLRHRLHLHLQMTISISLLLPFIQFFS